MDLKRKKWQSKTSSELEHSKRQVLHQCLPFFSRLFSSWSFRKTQENGRKNPCSETTHVVEIPEDIVEEILHRLPAKSLLTFKSVSREWKSLIQSGHLANRYLLLRQKKYGVDEMWSEARALFDKCHSKYTGTEGNREPEHFLRVAGYCSGLACVYDLANLYLYNPTTNVIRTLTPPKDTIFSMGFGRDVGTRTYKVAVVYNLDDNHRLEVMVCNLGTSKWRWRYQTAGPMPLSFTQINRERNPIFVKGSVFWLLTPDHSEILAMDLRTEKFRTVSQPKEIDVSSRRIYMWSQQDRLCVSNITRGFDSDVWVLVQDDVSERWERHGFSPLDLPLEFNPALLPVISSLLDRNRVTLQSDSLLF